jgi:hypothetical protein
VAPDAIAGHIGVHLDDVVAARAARQHGVITLAQAAELGITRDQAAYRVRAGHWRRLHAGVLAVAGAPETFEQAVTAAVLAGEDGALASHSTAAMLWGFPAQDRESVEITVPRPRLPRLRGVRVHRTARLDDGDRSVVGGIPTTSIPRTLVDLTAVRGIGWIARAMDEALRANRTIITDVRRCAERLGGAPGRRPSVVRLLVSERLALGGGKTESWLERVVLGVLLEAGVPEPVAQHPVTISGRRYRLDFAWPDQRVDLEVDGPWHTTYATIQRDRQRDLALRRAGWDVVRVTAETPADDIVAAVLDALAR